MIMISRIIFSPKRGFRKRTHREVAINLWEDQKFRKKVSESHKKLWNTVERRTKKLRQISPRKDTSIEVRLQEGLTKLGIRFEKHKAILGQPDVFIGPNVCVFADGCYWHGCERCYNRNNFSSQQRARIVRDQVITQKLINDGYVVLRFWEHDINGSFEDRVMDEIVFTISEIKEAMRWVN